MGKYALGLDYGTESVRALLVDVAEGVERGYAVCRYPHGVITESLPSGEALGREWALQHPEDYLSALEEAVRSCLGEAGVPAGDVVGIGVDFTACTILPTDGQGQPLCLKPEYARRPHAWPKLWKHHGARAQTARLQAVAEERGERFLRFYGGRLGCEWAHPKMLQVFEEDPEVFAAADRFIEGGDWVVWQMTGVETRNSCAAGYKGLSTDFGYPDLAFLEAVAPGFSVAYNKLAGRLVAPGRMAGRLTPDMASRLGLNAGTPVSAALIDAHAGVPGCGVATAGPMVLIMGTSTCHMVNARRLEFIRGMAGVVRDGILPGLYGYEYGQAAVGDILGWFVRKLGGDHITLSEKAARLKPGESGLVALDWHNGNRSPLMDAGLSGLIVGLTLDTKPEEIYRALIEATAFGTKRILEMHASDVAPVDAVYACGGLAQNQFLMQVYADVLEREIRVASSMQPVALGAAIMGALAAGTSGGGYATMEGAVAAMTKPPTAVYVPRKETSRAYRKLYGVYEHLLTHFGVERAALMHELKELTLESA